MASLPGALSVLPILGFQLAGAVHASAAPVSAPVSTVLPTESATASVGTLLGVSSGTWNDGGDTSPVTSYQWQVSTDLLSWSDISGATANAFTPTAAMVGNYLRPQVTRTNALGPTTVAAGLPTVGALNSESAYGLSGTVTNSTGVSTFASSGLSGCSNSSAYLATVFGWWKYILSSPSKGLTFNMWNDDLADSITVYTSPNLSTSIVYTPTNQIPGTSSPQDFAHRHGASVPITIAAPAGGLIYGIKIDWGRGVTSTNTGALDCRGISGMSILVYPQVQAAAPSTPISVMAQAGNASALVSWTAPSNNGSAITGYRVTSSPGGLTCTTTGATSCTVTGLTNGTPYTFTVTATNAIGTSQAATTGSITPALLTLTGSAAVTTTTGVNFASGSYVAAGGFGNKQLTYSLSPSNSGITLDTSTLNIGVIKVSSAVSAGTYIETITATDSASSTTSLKITINVVGGVLETATTYALNTTLGRPTVDTVFATSGTGNKAFTFTGNPVDAGVTLDTSTASSGYVRLNVSSSVPLGTYFESITATDSVGATTSILITLTVNPALVLTPFNAGPITMDSGTTLVDTFTASLGTPGYKYALTSSPTNGGITIDTSTSGIAVLKVTNSVPVGTYWETVTVTDTVGATAVSSVLINVVFPRIITQSATCTPDAGFTNCIYVGYTGKVQSYALPSYMIPGLPIQIEEWGAGGGGSWYTSGYVGSNGGAGGGYAKATHTLRTRGETLTVLVGQGGASQQAVTTFGGGGAGGQSSGGQIGSNGGGYSAIYYGSDTSTPFLISGGGGGASPGDAGNVAGGGGAAGNSGVDGNGAGVAGGGGTLAAGGVAASGCNVPATAGSRYQGGNGAGSISVGVEGGGGGGGGYYGGGGGSCQGAGQGAQQNGGGGGGSGYINTAYASIISALNGNSGTQGYANPGGTGSAQWRLSAGVGGYNTSNSVAQSQAGNGLIVIQWNANLPVLSFDSNTSTSGLVPDSITATDTITFTVPGNTRSLTKNGFTAVNWNTVAAGTGTTYNFGDSLTTATNVKLYAQYGAALNFDLNSGTGTTPATINRLNTNAFVLPSIDSSTFSNAGTTFTSWNTRADGTGTFYRSGDTITLTPVGGVQTLYAYWAGPLTLTGSTGTTLKTTVTIAASETITALSGTGTKRFTLASSSNMNGGITLDTSTAGSGYVVLKVSTTTLVDTYTETITVVDSVGATTLIVVKVIVNPFPVFNGNIVSFGLALNLDAGNPSSYGGSGTTWSDLSGNGKNGTFVGSPTFTTNSGGYFTFDGTTKYGTAPSLGLLTNFTAEAWSKQNATPVANQGILTETQTTGALNFEIYWNSANTLIGGYKTAAGVVVGPTVTFTPTLNTWNHFAVTFDGANVKLYINGVLMGTAAASGILASSGQGLNIGAVYNHTVNNSASISAAHVYNRSLTGAEILQNYYALANRYGSTVSGDSYVALSQAGTLTTPTYVAGSGTDTITITSTPTIAGLTSNISGSTISFTAANTLATGTYTETVTGTDSVGAKTTFRVYITMSANVSSSSTTNNIVTTFGTGAVDTITFSGGSQPITYSLTGSPSSNYFTIDTSTSGSGYLRLVVNPLLPAGTYTETITVTDALGYSSTQIVIITINAPPQLTHPQGYNGVGLTATDYSKAILKTGLAVQLEFNDTSTYSGTGTTITSLVGTIAGTTTNSPAFTASGGGYFTLDGVNGLNKDIRTSTGSATTGNISQFAWVYPTADGVITSEYNAGAGWLWQNLIISGGKLLVQFYQGTLHTSTMSVPFNQWNYVGYTYDGTTIKSYINGQLAGTSTSARTAPSSDQWLIGYGYNGYAYGNFRIGSLHVYSTTLSALDIQKNFVYTEPRFDSVGVTVLQTTAGTPVSKSGYVASLGTGNKTISISPSVSGASIDTSTTNQANYSVNGTVAAGSIIQRIKAVDLQGSYAQYNVLTIINPALTLTASALVETTSAGVAIGPDTVTVTGGTGTHTFALTGSPTTTGFTLTSISDTQTALTVAGTVPAGIYFETVTVSDSVGATTSSTVRVIVNGAASLSASAAVVNLNYGSAVSDTVTVTGGTAPFTFVLTGSPTNSGIVLDSTLASSGQAVVKFAATVPAGQYSETVTVTDSRGGTSTTFMTFYVNATVNFYLNGGTGTTPSPITQSSLSTISLPDSTGFSRPGYTFQGWVDSNTVFPGAPNTVTNLPSGNNPTQVLLSNDGITAYTTNWPTNIISEVNVHTGARTDITVGSNPYAEALSPDGTYLWVSNWSSNTVSRITLSNNAVTAVTVGTTPAGLKVTPDGKWVYVTNWNSSTVSKINTTTLAVTTINVGSTPHLVLISPDSNYAYVANWNSYTISKIAINGDTVTSISVGNYPRSMAMTPNGQYLYVANFAANTLTKYNTSTGATTTISMPSASYPLAVVASPDSAYIYVSDNNTAAWSKVAVNGDTVTTTALAGNPAGLAITQDGQYLFISDWSAASIYKVKLSDGTFATLTTNYAFNDVEAAQVPVLSPDGNELYFAEYGSSGIAQVIYSNTYTPLTSPYLPPRSLTLAAVWTPNTYTITYDTNGATSGSVPAGGSYTTAGTLYPVSANSGNLAKTGYSFAGWNTTADGSGTTYQPYATESMTVNQTLYAKWTANVFTVTYVTAGGLLARYTDSSTAASPITLPAPTRSGYTFTGWVDSATIYPGSVDSVTSLAAGNNPGQVLLSNNGTTAWVTNSGTSTVSRINTQTNTKIDITIGSTPYGEVLTPDGLYLWVTTWFSDHVYKISTVSNTVVASYHLGSAPDAIAMSPDGRSVYVAHWNNNTVVQIDATTGTTLNTYTTGAQPEGMVISPDGQYIFTSNYNSSNVTCITVSTGAVVNIATGANPWSMTFNATGSMLYVSSWGSSNVTKINVASGTVVSTITTGTHPGGGALSPDGAYLYVPNWSSANISRINTANDSVTTIAMPSGAHPWGASITSDGTLLYLADGNTAKIYKCVISASGCSSFTTLTTDSYIGGPLASSIYTPPIMVFSPDQNLLYATDWVGTTISQIKVHEPLTTLQPGSYVPTRNTTLLAQWTPITYTITYDTNGAISGTVPAPGSYVSSGTTYTIANNTGSLAKTGYTFNGWNTAANGSGTSWAVGASDTQTSNLYLYAQWAANPYTISFNANGGSGTMAGESITAGVAVLLNSNTFFKSGYTFSGWNDTTTGTGASYSDATSVTFYSNKTLYAQWVLKVPDSPTVTTVVAGNDSITVTVTASLTGGAASAETVTVLDAGGNPLSPALYCTIASGSGSCSISGLTNLTTYKVVAVSSNSTGSSVASPAVSAIPQPWLVTFNPDTGTVSPTTANFNYPTPLTLPTPFRSGYTFTGWYTAPTGGSKIGNAGDTFTVAGATTVYAQWVPLTYTIKYDTNTAIGGSVPAQGSFVAGGSAYQILGNTNNLSKPGYTFNGWNTGANGTGTSWAVGAYESTTANLYLYAQWAPISYTISFLAGSGATGTPPTQSSLNIGQVFTLPAGTGLTKTGYTFAGWSDTNTFRAGDTYTVGTANVTLTAQWTVNVYTITYDPNGATGNPADTSTRWTYGTSAPVLTTVGSMTKTGYSFGGWETATVNGTLIGQAPTTYTPTQSITLYALWNANTYSISFNPNGAGNTMAGESITAGAATALNANTLTRSGYSFANWATTANGTGTSYADTQTITVYGNLALYAQWTIQKPDTPSVTAVSAGNDSATITVAPANTGGTPSTYIVTASPGGATCSITAPATSCSISGLTNGQSYTFKVVANNASGNSPASGSSSSVTPSGWTVTYNAGSGTADTSSANYSLGTPLNLPNATQAGFTFAGWYTASTGGTLVGPALAAYAPTGPITVYAQWTGITYTIAYNANGGTGSVPANGSYVNGGTAYTIAGNTGALTKAGYTFGGWNTSSSGNGTTYGPASSNTTYSSAGNLSLYALWNRAPLAVVYANGGGTGTLPSSIAAYVGDTFTLPANPLTKSGYNFAGWSDGSNIYLAGSPYSMGIVAETLTAQWSGVAYTVTYSLNGATGTTPAEANHYIGDTFTVAAIGTSRTGFTFGGWNDGTSTFVGGATYTTISANILLTAQWNPLIYTIIYDTTSANGAATRGSDRYTYGAPVFSLPAVGSLIKPGYTFVGWADTSTSTTPLTDPYLPTQSTTLYAIWSANTYAIAYDANGGGTPDTPTVTYTSGTGGMTLELKGGMSRTGYAFGGWSTSATGSPVVTNGFSPTRDQTLYAVWTINNYTVTYNYGSGGGTQSDSLPATSTVSFNNTFTVPYLNSTDTSFAFAGWSDGPALYAPGSTYRVGTNNVTMTATWVRIYMVHYILNGGTPAINDVQHADGETITLASAPSRTGYAFAGWSDVLDSGNIVNAGDSYTVGATHYVLSARWNPQSLTLTFDTGTTLSLSVIYGNTTTLPDGPTQNGYLFKNWLTGANTTYGAGATLMVTSPMSFTAEWTPVKYFIYYDLALGHTDTLIANIDPNVGDTIVISSVVPVRTGYTFVGWSDGGLTAPVGGGYWQPGQTYTQPASNVTLTAVWQVQSFPVLYNLNGGTGGSAANTTANYAAIFNLPTAPAYANHSFTGWSDGTNTLAAGASYTMVADTVTFTAQWVNTLFTASYALGGATGSTPTNVNVNTGDTFTVSSISGISKTGYTFLGWNDGTNTFAAGAVDTMGATNVVLTAQWALQAPGSPAAPTAVFGNGSATISVIPPSSGGAPTSYTISASPGGATCTVTAPATSCTISPLTNGTAYTFSYTATNAAGTSAASPSSAPVVPAGVPSAPTLVIATAGNGQATISFTAPANMNGDSATSYTVTAYPGSGSCTATAPATTCTVAGLTNGTAETFTVTATNKAGTSAPSLPSGSVTPASPPPAPTIDSVTVSGGSATIYFTQPTNTSGAPISGYSVTSSPAGLSASGTTSPIIVPNLVTGTQYTFTVTAANAAGSAASSSSQTVVSALKPSAPPAPVAAAGNASATITITPPSNNGGDTITSYTVTASPGGESVTVAGLSATIPGLTNGQTYTFTVVATNLIGISIASAASNSVTPIGPAAAPTSVSAVAGIGSATVSFTAPSNTGGSAITGYIVTASPDGETATATTSPITVTGLTNGNGYTFTVQAITAAGVGTASGVSSSVTPANRPSAPISPVATPMNGGASVAFTAPANNGSAITSYTVTASPGGATASGSAAPIIISGLTNGTAYTFVVTATNGVGASYSSSASVAVTPNNVPDPPTIDTVTVGNRSATITLSPPTNNGGSPILSYTITATLGGASCTVNAPATTCTITGLTPGSTNSFSAVATNAVGTSQSSIPDDPAIPIAAPDTPTGVSASASDRGATIYFTAPADNGSPITSYVITNVATGDTYSVSSSPATVAPLTNGALYNFTVVAVNAAGASTAATTSVTPRTTPGAPTIGYVVPGNDTASVTVVAPTTNGGSLITSYTVTASPGGATCTVTSPATSCVVSGLTNGSAYTFAATATNGAGTSPSSAPSSSVTPRTVPSPPTGAGVVAAANSAIVIFTPSSLTGGSPILYYTVTSSPGGYVASDTGSPITVLGLTNGTVYTFTVNAVNAAGQSVGATTNSVTPVDVPGAPTSVTAIAQDRSALVSFTVPTNNGGSGITSYTVTASPGGATCQVAAPGTSCVVLGLTDGTPYTFTVVANNIVGPSVNSAPSASVTPAALTASPTTSSSGTVGTSTSINLGATGGTQPLTYVLDPTATLPAGMTFDPNTGSISGIPSTAGTYVETVTATDGAGASVASVVTITVADAPVNSPPVNNGGGFVPASYPTPAPSAPMTPTTPIAPVIPTTPTTPAAPITPAAPVTPSTPVAPVPSVIPPATSPASIAPDIAAAISKSVASAAPVKPTFSATSVLPVVPNAPAQVTTVAAGTGTSLAMIIKPTSTPVQSYLITATNTQTGQVITQLVTGSPSLQSIPINGLSATGTYALSVVANTAAGQVLVTAGSVVTPPSQTTPATKIGNAVLGQAIIGSNKVTSPIKLASSQSVALTGATPKLVQQALAASSKDGTAMSMTVVPPAGGAVSSYIMMVTDRVTGIVTTQEVAAGSNPGSIDLAGLAPGDQYSVAVVAVDAKGEQTLALTSAVTMAGTQAPRAANGSATLKQTPGTTDAANAPKIVNLVPKISKKNGVASVTINNLKSGQRIKAVVKGVKK